MGFDIALPVYGLILGVGSVAIILSGRYKVVEITAKLAAGVLVISAVAVYFVKPAPISSMAHFFIFETPEGSWLIIAAFLGLLPTGIDVSLQASEWGKAKRIGMGRVRRDLESAGLAKRFDPFSSTKEDLAVDTKRLDPHTREYCRRWFRISMWDFRFGHIVSFFMASIFLILAAMWLYPSSVEGKDVMGEIAKIFTASVGPELMALFLIGAFAATFSTAFNYFDGWPRVVGACCRNIFPATASLRGIARRELTDERRKKPYSEYNIYRLTMLFSLVASVSIVWGLPKPVYLVLVASALALFVAPVIFFLNLYYCLKVIPKDDKVFYPSKFDRWASAISLVVFTGLTAILIMARLFEVALFGA